MDTRQTPDGDLSVWLDAANLKISESRLESLRDELLAITALAREIADIVVSSPRTIPIVSFQSRTPDQEFINDH